MTITAGKPGILKKAPARDTRDPEGQRPRGGQKGIQPSPRAAEAESRAVPAVILPGLHDADTGLIDARRLADFMGVALKPLTEGLGLNYKTVHRTPAAAAAQPALRPVKRSLEILLEFLGSERSIRVWLNTPHPDLGGATAMETVLKGRPDAVARILESALNGVPV